MLKSVIAANKGTHQKKQKPNTQNKKQKKKNAVAAGLFFFQKTKQNLLKTSSGIEPKLKFANICMGNLIGALLRALSFFWFCLF
jgi:hypothetical protein